MAKRRDRVARPDLPEIPGPGGKRIDYSDMMCPALSNFLYIDASLSPAEAQAKPEKPVLVKTGGQSGSGKSQLVAHILADLSKQRGGVIYFDWDNLRRFKPDAFVKDLHQLDPEDLARYRSMDLTFSWCKQIVDEAFKEQRHFVLDGRLECAAITRSSMEEFAENGYEVWVAAMAVHPLHCRLGDLLRMARACSTLQTELAEAARLPEPEREKAILSAQRKNFPRHSLLNRHEQDVLEQLESFDELERLIIEGKVARLDVWERNRTTPSLSVRAADDGQIIYVDADNDFHKGHAATHPDSYRIGTASRFYRQIMERWTAGDQASFAAQLAEAEELLDGITLPSVDVQKYQRYVEDLKQACLMRSPNSKPL